MNSAFLMVLASSVLWAVQPVFILVVGRMSPDGALLFLALNKAGTLVLAALAMARFSDRKVLRDLFARPKLRRDLAVTLVLDAVFISLSYVFLALSAARSNLATSAIFFESWPIFAAVLMFTFLRRPDDSLGRLLAALVLFVAGLAILNAEGTGTILGALSADGVLPIASGVSMGAAAFITQRFMRLHTEFTSFRNFVVVVFLRNLFSTGLLAVAALVWWPAGGVEVSAGFLLLAMAFGGLVLANSLLYHIGVARSDSNAVALVALLSPVLAPVILFALGLGVPSVEFFVGAAFIVAGVSVTARTRDNTAQFQLLLFVMLLSGSVIVFVNGLGVANYYLYIQATAVFYGLFQTSALSRLYDRYVRGKRLALEIYEICRARAYKQDPLGYAMRKRELRSIKSEVSSVSELLLLTLFATANVLLAVVARDNSLEGDTIAYVITVASSFMVLICWYYQFRIMAMTPLSAVRLSRRPTNVLLARSLSYAVSSTLFFWILFVILFKHQPFAAP